MKERLLVALVLLPLGGCIYTQTHTTDKIAERGAPMDRSAPMVEVRGWNTLKIQAVLYKPTELPLSVFFQKLEHGDFRGALRRFNIRYSPSNADSRALKALLDNGFEPVLVSVANTGDKVEDTGRLLLRLHTPNETLDPIPNLGLPQAFETINWKSIPANAYNTTVLVVGVAADLVATAYTGAAGLYGVAALGTLTNKAMNGPLAEEKAGIVWNPIRKTHGIDYDSYLFDPVLLKPGQSELGLLFFRSSDGFVDWRNSRLEAAAALTPVELESLPAKHIAILSSRGPRLTISRIDGKVPTRVFYLPNGFIQTELTAGEHSIRVSYDAAGLDAPIGFDLKITAEADHAYLAECDVENDKGIGDKLLDHMIKTPAATSYKVRIVDAR